MILHVFYTCFMVQVFLSEARIESQPGPRRGGWGIDGSARGLFVETVNPKFRSPYTLTPDL